MPIGPAIVRAVKAGLSATRALKVARDAGLKTRDATWYRAYSEVRRALGDQINEASRPLHRKPRGDEISVFSTKAAKGFIQYVEVFVRDRRSGLVMARPFAVRSPTLVTRRAAIERAVEAMQRAATEKPDTYEEDVLFGAYTASYQMVPRE